MEELEAVNSEEENVAKKAKPATMPDKIQNKINLPAKPKPERCNICRQFSDNITIYNGHPNNSIEEYIALTDDKLSLFTGDESHVMEQDNRPTHKVLSNLRLLFHRLVEKQFIYC